MAMDILVFLIGTTLIFVMGYFGFVRMPLVALFGLIFGMIFTGTAISAAVNNSITLLGTPVDGAGILATVPLFATLIDLIILVDKLR